MLENPQIVCIILIDFFRSIFLFFRGISKKLFFREFFFTDLSISTKRTFYSDYSRRKNSSMTLFNNRDRFYDRIFIREFFFKIVNSTIKKPIEDSLMTHCERLKYDDDAIKTRMRRIPNSNQYLK